MMAGSTRSQYPKAVDMAELLAGLRLAPYVSMNIGTEHGRFEISADDWNFILDAAQEKLNREGKGGWNTKFLPR